MSRRAALIQHVTRSGFDGRSKPASQQTQKVQRTTLAGAIFRSNMSRRAVFIQHVTRSGLDGRSKLASQQTKNAENNTGGSNFDPTCHEERIDIFEPTYELLARQRQTVMLRRVKPTRPGQHQQHQRTRPGQHQQHQRRPVFPLDVQNVTYPKGPKSGPKQAPLATGLCPAPAGG